MSVPPNLIYRFNAIPIKIPANELTDINKLMMWRGKRPRRANTVLKGQNTVGIMWGLDHTEGWAPRTDAFEQWYWRRLLRVPWTARRSNQSILKEISPEYSLEGQMLKLKLQYFGHLMWRANSLEKTLMLGKIEGRRRRGQQRMRWFWWHHWLSGHEFEQALGVGDG